MREFTPANAEEAELFQWVMHFFALVSLITDDAVMMQVVAHLNRQRHMPGTQWYEEMIRLCGQVPDRPLRALLLEHLSAKSKAAPDASDIN